MSKNKSQKINGDRITVGDIADHSTIAIGRNARATSITPSKNIPDISKPVKVFISSTWQDLRTERKMVEQALDRMKDTIFIGMEHFGSRPNSPRNVSLEEVQKSNLYIGIFAHRYGSGITEAEYRKAISLGLPVLIYFKEEEPPISNELLESDDDKRTILEKLKIELLNKHTVTKFQSAEELARHVVTDLHNLFIDHL